MKDTFSFSSAFPKLSGVHFGFELQHLKHALLVSSLKYSLQGENGLGHSWAQNCSGILDEHLGEHLGGHFVLIFLDLATQNIPPYELISL